MNPTPYELNPNIRGGDFRRCCFLSGGLAPVTSGHADGGQHGVPPDPAERPGAHPELHPDLLTDHPHVRRLQGPRLVFYK